MNWLRASLIAQALLAVYVQVAIWFPFQLFGYSSLPIVEQIGIGTTPLSIAVIFGFAIMPPLLFAVGYRRKVRSLMWICAAHYSAWLGVEVKCCFVARPWSEVEHMMLPALLFAVVLSSIVGLVKLERKDGRPFPLWIFR